MTCGLCPSEFCASSIHFYQFLVALVQQVQSLLIKDYCSQRPSHAGTLLVSSSEIFPNIEVLTILHEGDITQSEFSAWNGGQLALWQTPVFFHAHMRQFPLCSTCPSIRSDFHHLMCIGDIILFVHVGSTQSHYAWSGAFCLPLYFWKAEEFLVRSIWQMPLQCSRSVRGSFSSICGHLCVPFVYPLTHGGVIFCHFFQMLVFHPVATMPTLLLPHLSLRPVPCHHLSQHQGLVDRSVQHHRNAQSPHYRRLCILHQHSVK